MSGLAPRHLQPLYACVQDAIELRAKAFDPDGDRLTYAWATTGGRLTPAGAQATLNTDGLAPGAYTVTVEVDDGGGCVGFDWLVIQVVYCPDFNGCLVCFNANLAINQSATTIKAGGMVDFSTPGIVGGRSRETYGRLTCKWTASAGAVKSDGVRMILDTSGLTPGLMVEVRVTVISEYCNCSAAGAARLRLE